ncbi:MAG: pyridoxal-phosphate dependent enzyme [Anaerolineales bacterium]
MTISTGGSKSTHPPILCRGCGDPYPSTGFPYKCPNCSDVFAFAHTLSYQPILHSPLQPNRIARYIRSFPLEDEGQLVSLGEGRTPLLAVNHDRHQVYLKCEQYNPTGSFKDRGTAILMSSLRAAGVEAVVEDSSGNAGASLAAYAARCGLKVKIFVPSYASGPKRSQIAAYGAEIVEVSGPRTAASDAVMEEAARGMVYASHAYLPHGLAGIATMAFEIVEQLEKQPGTVVVPVGQGTLLLGLHMGFEAMKKAGAIARVPRLLGVQAAACAPISTAYVSGMDALEEVQEGETRAEGIRILQPLHTTEVIRAVCDSHGEMVAVDEDEIAFGRDALGKLGFYVEPTSAVIWPGIARAFKTCEEPIVAVITGSGYKSGG